MSLQDDVFDVKGALQGLPEQRAFERIEAALWQYEENSARYRKILDAARSGFWALQEISNEGLSK